MLIGEQSGHDYMKLHSGIDDEQNVPRVLVQTNSSKHGFARNTQKTLPLQAGHRYPTVYTRSDVESPLQR